MKGETVSRSCSRKTSRAVLTNYVLVITAAISGFIVQQDFG